MSGPPSTGPSRGRGSWKTVTDYDPDRRGLRLGAAVAGVVALAAALAVVTGIGGPGVTDLIATVVWPARPFVFLFAQAAVVFGAWSLWRASRTADDDADVRLPPPRSVESDEATLVGADVDEKLAALADPAGPDGGWRRVDVERTVRSLAVEVLHAEAGYDYEEIGTALERGTWTDDPRAATYLGEDVPLPIRLRVVDWVRGDPYRRRVEATVAELADLAGVDAEVAS